jgi:uncharacterized secreted protein with C-terminal beta-propeller domain
MDLGTFKTKVIDSFEVDFEEFEYTDGVDFPDYMLIEGDLIYYSYNGDSYSIKADGTEKKKIADFPIRGDMYFRNNKLLWYYQKGQDSGFGGYGSIDDSELFSYDLSTKEIKQYLFDNKG